MGMMNQWDLEQVQAQRLISYHRVFHPLMSQVYSSVCSSQNHYYNYIIILYNYFIIYHNHSVQEQGTEWSLSVVTTSLFWSLNSLRKRLEEVIFIYTSVHY